MPQQVFTGSQQLKQIVEGYDWSLHNIIQSSLRMEPFTWDEIGMRDSEDLYIWETYIFLPKPKQQQSMAQAFTQKYCDGNFPVLAFPKNKVKNGLTGSDPYSTANFDFYFLTHLILKDSEAVAVSYPLAYPPYSSRVSMPLNSLVPIFAEHFSIVQFDQQGEPHFKAAKHHN